MVSCSNGAFKHRLSENFTLADGSVSHITVPDDSAYMVFIFLAPDCPLCVNYTLTINDLAARYTSAGINFYTVYPGTFYTLNEIRNFQSDHHVQIPGVMDNEYKITRHTDATVTPQAVVMDKSGDIIYTGAIDNWAYTQGGKRQNITEFYLKDALEAIAKGNKPEIRKTEAIGCFIE